MMETLPSPHTWAFISFACSQKILKYYCTIPFSEVFNAVVVSKIVSSKISYVVHQVELFLSTSQELKHSPVAPMR